MSNIFDQPNPAFPNLDAATKHWLSVGSKRSRVEAKIKKLQKQLPKLLAQLPILEKEKELAWDAVVTTERNFPDEVAASKDYYAKLNEWYLGTLKKAA